MVSGLHIQIPTPAHTEGERERENIILGELAALIRW